MIDIIVFSLGFLALFIASIVDLKTKEVPDTLSYGLIFGLPLLYLIKTLIVGDWTYFITSLAWTLIFVGLAFAAYYTGQWGGGDSKLLMSMGALFSFYPEFLQGYFNPILEWPLPLIFLINLMVFGAAYGLIFSAYFAFRDKDRFFVEWRKISSSKRVTQSRNFVLIFMVVFIILALFMTNIYLKLLLFSTGLVLVLIYFLILFAKSVEEACMLKEVKTSQLTEGDWIVNDIYHKKKRIVGPSDLGISLEQIAELKRAKISKVLIKEGIPFVPSFLLAAIFTWIFGNLIFYLI